MKDIGAVSANATLQLVRVESLLKLSNDMPTRRLPNRIHHITNKSTSASYLILLDIPIPYRPLTVSDV